MNETKVQSKFTKWVRLNAPSHPLLQSSFGYEIKVARGRCLAFSAFRPQQIPFLERTKDPNSFVHKKLSDADPSMKPYDGVYFHNAQAYVMIYFDTSKAFYVIDVTMFVEHIKSATRKSIIEADCRELSLFVLTL